MANDEIRDLMGRYATGSLSAEEHQRLFDAALDDQDLFDELAREQELKSLIDEPGARDRLIRALEPPKRKVSWIFALVPVAAAIVFAILFVYQLRKPAPQSSQVATATTPPPQTEIASAGKPPAEPSVSQPQPAASPRLRDKALEPPPPALEKKVGREEEDRKSLDRKEEAKKDAAKDQIAAASPPPPLPKEKQAAEAKSSPEAKSTAETVQVQAMAPEVRRYDAQQQNAQKTQNAAGGPRQQYAVQQPAPQKARAAAPVAGASAGLLSLPPFGFHYSVETPGHLIIIPAADGTLSVKSADGAVLFAPQRIAVGITNDIALPDTVSSVSIVFSRGETAARVTPSIRTDPQGDVAATSGSVASVAIDLKINR